jgi:hypothetical protein
VLACWEPPEAHTPWCHRGLVSAWFKDTLGIDVPELGQGGCIRNCRLRASDMSTPGFSSFGD